jgi:hypothetical protein
VNKYIFSSIWKTITNDFNAGSGRSFPSSVVQLTKLSQKIRDEERKKSDQIHRKKGMKLSEFKRSCLKTGGGKAEKEPEGEALFKYCLAMV